MYCSLILCLTCLVFQAVSFPTTLTTVDYLSNYDVTIVNQLSRPEVEKSKEICENVKKFNAMMRDVLSGFEAANPEFGKMVQELWMRGQPSFIRFTDFTDLRSTYRWGDLNVSYFFNLIAKSNKLWHEFRIKCEENMDICAPRINRHQRKH